MNTDIHTYNSIERVSIERLEEIQSERDNTISNPEFIQWCKDMKIGHRVQRREGIDRANEMMALWTSQAELEATSWMPEWVRRMY